jgi:hypothetical protein
MPLLRNVSFTRVTDSASLLSLPSAVVGDAPYRKSLLGLVFDVLRR